jgi:hypothetical protein
MKEGKIKESKIKFLNLFKKFNLEFSAAEGSLRVDTKNNVNLDNIPLSNDKRDSMIHVKYCPEEKKYRYAVYKKEA